MLLMSMQGELVEESSIQRSSLVATITWHPVRKILAIGWQSGDVLIWNEHDRELHEASSIHQSPVKIIHWSNNGNRLVTCDEVGKEINHLSDWNEKWVPEVSSYYVQLIHL